jgi:sporulation protein YlmC with PRC-barrel domain
MSLPILHRLSDTDLQLAHTEQDIRGFTVLDASGADVGQVDDLIIDADERKVRFLRVASGGFLGFGANTFMIPVEAIKDVRERTVHVDRERHLVAGAPQYDPELEPQPELMNNLYGYYGYPPYWGPMGNYPPNFWA